MFLFAGAILFIGGNLARVAAQETPPAPAPYPSAIPVAIDVDLGQKIGAWRPIYAWFGYDEGNYTNTTAGVKLLRELHDLSPAPVYVRFHHLLTSGDGTPELKWSSTGVYHEDANGKAIYNFVILDGIFDALVKAGVRPFVELGFMPQDLAASLPNRHEPYQVNFPGSAMAGASNNPPKDYAKWGELVRVVAAHLVERYGRRAVLTWYFEVWNEPDIDYWHAAPEDYWKLYDYAVAGVRAALPGARVGGPATTGPGGAKAAAFLEGFLRHVSSGRSAVNGKPVPLDFISFHAKGQPALEDGQVRMGLNHELTDADRGFAIVAKFRQLRHLPVILSEADPEGCAACSRQAKPGEQLSERSPVSGLHGGGLQSSDRSRKPSRRGSGRDADVGIRIRGQRLFSRFSFALNEWHRQGDPQFLSDGRIDKRRTRESQQQRRDPPRRAGERPCRE